MKILDHAFNWLMNHPPVYIAAVLACNALFIVGWWPKAYLNQQFGWQKWVGSLPLVWLNAWVVLEYRRRKRLQNGTSNNTSDNIP